MMGEDIVYNSKSGLQKDMEKLKLQTIKKNVTITGEEVIYNANTGHSEGMAMLKLLIELKQRTITGDKSFI